MSGETKACPLCCEEIMTAAIKCKHCGSMLINRADGGSQPSTAQSVPTTPVPPLPLPSSGYVLTPPAYQAHTNTTKQPFDFKTFYFSFQGRASRSDYFLKYFLPYLGIYFVFLMVDLALGTMNVFSLIFSIATFYSGLCVIIKRFHDVDKSGWYMLVPVYGLILNWFVKGTGGANNYGPDPLG